MQEFHILDFISSIKLNNLLEYVSDCIYFLNFLQ